MKKRMTCALLVTLLMSVTCVLADNPFITDQFTADPTARVFEGKIYVFPSHDIPVPPDSGARPNWFCMEDYHVFSSENLMDWEDHGVILTQTEVPWLRRKSYNMWAPDCVTKDGKYYFYFPTGNSIGVAIADKPYGPYKPEETNIQGVFGIDPGVIIDKDGSVYMFYSDLSVVKLKSNMVEIDGRPSRISNLPKKGLREGPFPFERNGIYYLTYPHVENNTERLEYATASHPMGPYEWKGVIMDESESGCWTNHHSIVEYKGQWYLFYHDKDLSPGFDKNRAIKADYLTFNEDGTIQKVIPTVRGIGICDASREIQIDRYSALSSLGTMIAYLNDENTFQGWKTILSGKYAWIQYDRVEFNDKPFKNVKIKVKSSTGGSVAIHLDSLKEGPLVSQVKVPQNSNWSVITSELKEVPTGLHNLVVSLEDSGNVEIDWISFE